ncbi:MAG: SOS response-associated peptidase [Clostridiales bacterium]|nr:SOS response-associated peptidase [Clostridiales bacterium]
MCGRYTLYTDRDIEDLDNILSKIDDPKKENMKTGEIFPSNTVPVLLYEEKEIKPQLMVWGFPGFKNKQLIINARSETAAEKPMFKTAMQSRRCVIISTGFFEWDCDKRRYQFNMPDSEMLFMAGLYSHFDEDDRFVILTKEANSSISQVHHRIPVVLEQRLIHDWLANWEEAQSILSFEGPKLVTKPSSNQVLSEQIEIKW